MNFTKVQIIDTENAKENLKKKKQKTVQTKYKWILCNEAEQKTQSKSIIDVDSY